MENIRLYLSNFNKLYVNKKNIIALLNKITKEFKYIISIYPKWGEFNEKNNYLCINPTSNSIMCL